MSTDRLQNLLAVVDLQDRAEVTVAHNAMISALKTHGLVPTAATVANKNATREDYDATVSRLESKYFPDDQPATEGERFANRKQALNWLQAQGYKVSQGKFYQDCEAGLPALHRDGKVSRYQVMQYGQQLDGATRAVPHFDQSARREDLEIRKLEAEVNEKEQKARKEDARWMLREDTWAAVAALLSTLQDGIRHHLHQGQGLLVFTAGGDPAKEPEVFELAVELVGRAFGELAGLKIEGMFGENSKQEDEEDE